MRSVASTTRKGIRLLLSRSRPARAVDQRGVHRFIEFEPSVGQSGLNLESTEQHTKSCVILCHNHRANLPTYINVYSFVTPEKPQSNTPHSVRAGYQGTHLYLAVCAARRAARRFLLAAISSRNQAWNCSSLFLRKRRSNLWH